VTRNHERNQWAIHLPDRKEEYFDKVVISTGINSIPMIPKMEGLDQFQGQVLHSQAFKEY
jgi:dimethylaniline monooxygenase (N-oxide forming)